MPSFYAGGWTKDEDGAKMYCKVWNRQGAEIETEHFTLKKYQGDVDRNITIRMPEVGETYRHYIDRIDSIVPAELIIGDDALAIMMVDAGLLQPDKLPVSSSDI